MVHARGREDAGSQGICSGASTRGRIRRKLGAHFRAHAVTWCSWVGACRDPRCCDDFLAVRESTQRISVMTFVPASMDKVKVCLDQIRGVFFP